MTNDQPGLRRFCRAAYMGTLAALLLIAGDGIVWSSSACAQEGAEKPGREFNALAAVMVLEKRFVRVIADAEQSVVSIARVKKPSREKVRRPINFFGPIDVDRDDPTSPDFLPSRFGSGVIIAPLKTSAERFILTNYHVVKGGPVANQPDGKSRFDLYVKMFKRRQIPARIIAADPRSDLAILQIDYKGLKLKPTDLKPLKITSRDTFRKGQFVLSLGNPYAQARDGSASVSWGMISNISRRPKPVGDSIDLEHRRKETIHHFGTLLQVDTRLGIGTSGGALLDIKGELIGITTSLAALEGYESTVGYAIPFDAAMRRIVITLAKGLEAEYGFLGVSPVDASPERLGDLPRDLTRSRAPIVSSVHRQSPAGRAGIVPGDVVLDVNGKPVYDRYDLMRTIGLLGPGSTARLRVWRAGATRLLAVDVKLGKWPVLNDEDIIATAQRYPAWRGLTVDYPTSRHKYLQLPYRYHRAVVLLAIKNSAFGENSDLQPGDYITHVNGTSIETPAEFHAAVRNLKGAVTLQLLNGSRVEVPQ